MAPATRRGQAMVEFALAAPIVLLLILGSIESSLMLFVTIAANQAAAAAGATESVLGNAADADSRALAAIRATPLGTTGLAEVSEIDIARLTLDSSGHLTADPSLTDVYRLDGGAVKAPWPPSGRSVGSASADYLAVTIHYRFTQGNSSLGALLDAPRAVSYTVRLEPQTA